MSYFQSTSKFVVALHFPCCSCKFAHLHNSIFGKVNKTEAIANFGPRAHGGKHCQSSIERAAFSSPRNDKHHFADVSFRTTKRFSFCPNTYLNQNQVRSQVIFGVWPETRVGMILSDIHTVVHHSSQGSKFNSAVHVDSESSSTTSVAQ